MLATNSFIDTNSVDFRDSWPAKGRLISLSVDRDSITASGKMDGPIKDRYVLLVDKINRFIACQPLQATGEFQLKFPAKHREISIWPIKAYLYDAVSNKAFPTETSSEAATFSGNQEEIPSLTEKLRDVCIEAMELRYTSISSEGAIKTGNNYQSIDFDKTLTLGGRPARNIFFDHVNLKDKTALDVGANTGEQSRLARKRGASMVDGIEYDNYFVQTGRAINAATGMTRVSLFQGDATNPDTFDAFPRYDMILAFAVWVYIKYVLDKLAEKSDVVFFETHTLDHGLDMYIKPMTQYWPHFRVMGYDQMRDMRKSRGVLMFAKTREQLGSALNLESVTTEGYFDNAFFKAHPKTSSGEFISYIKHIADSLDETSNGFNGIGKQYFELFLAGYYEYQKNGVLSRENVFLRKYREAIQEGRIDSELRYLLDNENLLFQKIEKKYQDIDNTLAGRHHMVPPILIRPGDGKLCFNLVKGGTMRATNIDGHHRYFISQLLGEPSIDALIQEPIDVDRKVIRNDYRL